ncbi:dimethylamine monooxygenase subunit DmmA family protein [Bradyrhizobium sp. HKCCYLR20261]|uniref:dimethylamine monooxygenase subunit DmmA family protein n=1 Tax=Bradyrhizobium sp. HKCCYLR20261 TaxID=3420760 RepID=UPI003EBE10FE
MIVPSIKSRPVYGRLAPRPGTSHLLLGDREGGHALADLAAGASSEFLSRAHILYVRDGLGDDVPSERLASVGAGSLCFAPTVASILPQLTHLLGSARMGTRLYLAGTEGLIGQAVAAALGAGLEMSAIQAEHRGSLARRVQCVHCKGVTEQVTTQPVQCSHCGLHLFVRDHYSRRLAAFMGVCIDAEEPGVVPVAEDIFK